MGMNSPLNYIEHFEKFHENSKSPPLDVGGYWFPNFFQFGLRSVELKSFFFGHFISKGRKLEDPRTIQAFH